MFDQAFLDAACRLEDFLFTSPNTLVTGHVHRIFSFNSPDKWNI